MPYSPNATARDLWTHRDLGSFKDSYSAMIPAHGSMLLKVSGETNWQKGAVYEAEWPGNIRQGNIQLTECGECYAGFGMAMGGDPMETSSALIFPHVNVPRGGRYTLQLFYFRNGHADKKVNVQINDGVPVSLKILTYIWGSADVPVELKAGENSVAVSYTGKNSFYLDRIQIIPR